MKRIPLFVFVLGALAASAGVPVVDPATVSVVQEGPKVTVSYTLTGEEGIVTIDMQTNTLADASGDWISVGPENLRTLKGAVNCRVSALGVVQTATWKPGKEALAADRDRLGKVRAVVKAWSVTAPPDYLVVNLEKQDTYRYYTCTNAFPLGGLANDAYRSTLLVMRRIPAAGTTARQGATYWERRNRATDVSHAVSPAHLVSFTNDFYMSVYHLTHKQAHVIWPGVPQPWSAGGDFAVFSVAKWADVRGACTSGAAYDWPSKGHAVDPNSLLGRLRELSGIEFDLPTEAQWEFACRAGTETCWNNGSDEVADASQVAVCGLSNDQGYGYSPVGTKKPNAWGLYDMHGLIWDMCLDWWDPSPSVEGIQVDPVGPSGQTAAGGEGRVRRGGSWSLSPANGTRAASRMNGGITSESNYNGWRLVCPVTLKW